MRVALRLMLLVALVSTGCGEKKTGAPRTPIEQQMFGASAMRIHPIFTRVRDWTADGKPDGIDALIEFQDPFGDPTKAAGRVIFELHTYQKYNPDRRGERLCNPWVGSLQTLDEQRDRWNRTSRTYSFPLSYERISERGTYVLTAEFQLASGGRFFDEIVIEPPQGAYGSNPGQQEPTTAPVIAPSTQPVNGPTTEPGSRAPQP